MPYTVTVIATKPQGTEWWNYPPGSPNDQARDELFAWIATQPGYISLDSIVDGPDDSTNIYIFDTEANYIAYVTE